MYKSIYTYVAQIKMISKMSHHGWRGYDASRQPVNAGERCHLRVQAVITRKEVMNYVWKPTQ